MQFQVPPPLRTGTEHVPNPVNGQRLDGCIAVHQELRKINRKDQLSLIV